MRIAFKMSVYPEFVQEYEKRHNPIWDELKQVLLDHGVLSYSIFLDEKTHTLFAYAEIESIEQWDKIADTQVCQRWWDYMAPLMPVHEDNSPQSTPLRQVFFMEAD